MTTTMTEPLLPDLRHMGLAVERLSSVDQVAVADLCHRSTEFFELVEGYPASEETAAELLEAVPPGVEPARKHVLGFRRETALIGAVDLIDGYPGTGEWYVGLLLIEPSERGRGLGDAIWSELEGWIRSRGAHAVRLVVQEKNGGALRFWQSHGFVIDGESQQVLPKITNRIWHMRKDLYLC